MKKLLPVLAVAFSTVAMLPSAAHANPQHERMKRCSQEAKEKTLKGDERKQFMSTCLKGKHPETAASDKAVPAKPSAAPKSAKGEKTADAGQVAEPPSRMKTCNQGATERALKGDARKAYMSECLKG